ncbi:MAG: TDP-N-acetylfucosamine:lipid II N-acetylfucosaminyltransferase [Clostridia bacterium]|nr:TDP-N-acetylfucosamine:lipid II N-acetylfucosaminyltransferase [Clostridia bacterium]
MKILHIICNDKFTSGYINFMLERMKDYEHKFIVLEGKYEIDLKRKEYYDKIIVIKEMQDILNKNYKKTMKSSDKIIVSGIFGFEKYLPFLSNRILSKMYLQFWGGDFYYYRNTKIFTKKNIYKILLHYCIKKCRGIINLIANDYKELCTIFPNKTKSYVAIMPIDPRRQYVYATSIRKKEETNYIIIGNSAAEENCHVEVFEMIKHLKDDNIRIVCPLSYGNMDYAEEVIRIGKKIFQNKFEAITDYMEYEKYIKFLNKFQVGIFNNDRQQAMGNINALLRMGKKIYIREGTSMWEEYKNFGIQVFDINELKGNSLKQTFMMDDEIGQKNIQIMKKRDAEYLDGYNCWKKVLDL